MNLSAAQIERLALLLEEMGEVQQVVGKIIRHGYDSCHPDGGPTNGELLEEELGCLTAALEIMITAKDVDDKKIAEERLGKYRRVIKFLHVKKNQKIAEFLFVGVSRLTP